MQPRRRGRFPGDIAARVIVFMLLGAIVNVAVAWGCANYVELDENDPGVRNDPRDLACWSAHAPEWFPRQCGGSDRRTSFGVTGVFMWDRERDENEQAYPLSMTRTRAGLPMRSMEGTLWVDKVRHRGRHESSLILPAGLPGNRAVPGRPLIVGSIVNSSFWGTLLFLAYRTIRQGRQMMRRRRGRCSKCGYDLAHAEHDQCPECGVKR